MLINHRNLQLIAQLARSPPYTWSIIMSTTQGALNSMKRLEDTLGLLVVARFPGVPLLRRGPLKSSVDQMFLTAEPGAFRSTPPRVGRKHLGIAGKPKLAAMFFHSLEVRHLP